MKVEESTPNKIVMLIQERTGDQLARLTVEVEPAEPHAIKQTTQISQISIQTIKERNMWNLCNLWMS